MPKINPQADKKPRCEWALSDQLLLTYHDTEWGFPEHNDQKIFELLVLEGMQAGLSWLTILRKRENYRAEFASFNIQKIAVFDDQKVKKLLINPGIIRNRLKVAAIIKNAKSFIQLQNEFGSFDKYIWKFVNNKTIQNKLKTFSELPAKTILSDEISKDLRKRGFSFVGSVICYSFMQAIGMVNDHIPTCYRYQEVQKTSGI